MLDSSTLLLILFIDLGVLVSVIGVMAFVYILRPRAAKNRGAAVPRRRVEDA
ncbi:hypothetical protein DEU34_1440 [Microbacterium sp. AG1240]|uniref:hypothetical protein n=1 Tax=Microbacterium sp. AG1240 TaxID=2183992 RepID=UPI000F1CE841|nr:hypothetical protein [Microbacterium sp. AG1240]RKT36910.1 hypothetical protein DEU34_1440 [Microbacterium sp. AG1240]